MWKHVVYIVELFMFVIAASIIIIISHSAEWNYALNENLSFLESYQ